ncbi:TPA: 30S ribosomal protein S20 [Patescibacteria group bacterium]|nr:30S ribosomal protein S20 [Patescibacteria group bacterium]
MAITKSAKKAARGSLRKRVFNLRRAGAMRSSIKDVRKLVVAKNIDEAKKNLSEAYKAIDKAMKKGVIKKNTAARKKSRLAQLVKKASVK